MPKAPTSTVRRDLLVILVAALVVWLGPRLVRGYGALQWTRYHAAQPDATGQHAREAARWASTTMREVGPVPWAATAGQLALECGQRVSVENPAAALAVYENLRATLAGLAQSRWRILGLTALLEQAESRAQAIGATKSRGISPAVPGAVTAAPAP